MYLILNKNVTLRSYIDLPYAFHYAGTMSVETLSKEEFELLSKCDGNNDIKQSKLVDQLLYRRLCYKCEKGEKLLEGQKIRIHHNHYMPKMNLQITGRCNYNCMHCFNAKDNAPLQSELSLEQLNKLFDECEQCGVFAFTITGGEPLSHPNYKEIIESIYKRGMFVFDLNTNGFFITQEHLDWMKSIKYNPLIKISFDGLGFHNWMRGSSLAEERTLKAIKLCIDNGFNVNVQMNVNIRNLDSIVPSLIMLDKMGVKETRLIKTTTAPRWLKNSNGESMSLEQYFDAMLEITTKYLSEPRNMELVGWLLFHIDPKRKYYNLNPVECRKGDYHDTYPLCRGVKQMIAVGSNGNVFPCMQSQGWYEEHKMYWGNILTDGLENILKDSKYWNLISLTNVDRFKAGSSCKSCKYLLVCAGGCPAIAQLTSGDILLPDQSKCIFFKKGYYQKFVDAMPEDFENIKPIDNSLLK